MRRTPKVVLSVFGVSMISIAAFLFGKVTTWFDLNACYGGVINFIITEASIAMQTQDPDKVKEFQNVIQSLPLRGYETECNEVRDEISKYMAAGSLQPPKI